MSRLRKAAAGLLAAGVLTLSGCFGFGNTDGMTKNPLYEYDYTKMHLVQLEEPAEGQPTAVIETTLGTLTAVLYPEYAPNTVQNFIDRANEGFYDGQDIYNVIDKSIFMTGAADSNKNSGRTPDGQPIPNEYSVDLWPFKGALCSFSGYTGCGDSRFMVLNSRELTEEQINDLRSFKNENDEKLLPDTLIDSFVEKGVIIDFSAAYTVFGQTIDGFDVIEKICATEVSGTLSVPTTPVYVNKITIGEYHKA
ncbi:MAG: peptidylprolyl isomerase [Ruminiclostridium sp.]|nr:peptidylprolyl isomerase [Ruminiclostridium sp.]